MFSPRNWLCDEVDVDERVLIESSLRGELDAFNQLILLYQDYLFNLAVRILGDEAMAEDAVQETMISAFRKLSTFRGETLKPWLTRIMVNVCYDALRGQNRRPTVPLERKSEDDQEMEPGRWMKDPSPDPEEDCESRDMVRAIETCLQSLTPDFRTVLVLVDVEAYSYEEAAMLLAIPLNTVKSRLARARMKMAQELQNFKDQLPVRYWITGCSLPIHE